MMPPEVTVVPANQALLEPGQAVPLVVELQVRSRSVFEAAGFPQVSHTTPRRVVMRIDF